MYLDFKENSNQSLIIPYSDKYMRNKRGIDFLKNLISTIEKF